MVTRVGHQRAPSRALLTDDATNLEAFRDKQGNLLSLALQQTVCRDGRREPGELDLGCIELLTARMRFACRDLKHSSDALDGSITIVGRIDGYYPRERKQQTCQRVRIRMDAHE